MDNVKTIKPGIVSPLEIVRWLNANISDLDEVYVVTIDRRTGAHSVQCSCADGPAGMVWAAFLLNTIAQRELQFGYVSQPSPPSA